MTYLEKDRTRKIRLRTLQFLGACAAVAIAPQLLLPKSVKAQEDFVLNCKVGMFHHEGGASIATFIRQMEAEGRQNLFASELASALHERKSQPPSYVISVDDGYEVQREIFGYLAREGLERKVTLYVMGDWRGDGAHAYMSDSVLREVSQIAEIGCHTRDHPLSLPALRVNNYGSFLLQVDWAKKYLEDLTGKPVWTFAYPNGAFDLPTAQEISDRYLAAFTTQHGNIHYVSRSSMLPRIRVN